MHPSITLRQTTDEDEPLLYRIYASTRLEELQQFGWNEHQQAAFLKERFAARRIYYQQHFPNGTEQLILVDETPLGIADSHPLRADRGTYQRISINRR